MRTITLPLAACLASALVAVCGARTACADGARLRVPQDFATIQAAIDAAADGDTIDIARGTYGETLVIAGREGLTLRARGKVIVDPAGPDDVCLTVTGSTDITIERLRFADAKDGIALDDSVRVAVVRCRFDGFAEYGIRASACSRLRIERCAISTVGIAGMVLGDVSPVDDSFVTRTKVRDAERGGIVLGGARNRAERNTVIDAARHAYETRLVVASTENVLADNRARGGDAGFRLHGTANRIERGSSKGAVEAGVHVHADATGSVVIGVGVAKSAADGALVEGSGNTFTSCAFKKSARDGMAILGDTNVVEGVRVVGSGANGLRVGGSANSFSRVKVKKSVALDLDDPNGPGANEYADDNRIGTSNLGR